jgi:ABC-type amino acid transport system permease subunit
MLNFSKSLKFNVILRGFIIGLILAIVSGGAIKLFYNRADGLISIFIGFTASYFLFADTVLYLFRNIKKINLIKFNLTIIKDLLIILFFFIISYKFINLNFILVSAGITITPVSVAILRLFFLSPVF